MNISLRALSLVGLLSIFTGVASAQVATGAPPLGSFGGGPIDAINLANLNAHIDIPVLHKAGRGLPFDYDITYDSSIWTPVTSGSSKTWEPAGSFGWSAPQQGYVTKQGEAYLGWCYTGGVKTGTTIEWAFTYIDSMGTPHSFPGYEYYYSGSCGSGWSPWTSTAKDGSGYVLQIASSGLTTVTATNGVLVNTSSIYRVDTNGNEITTSGGQFFDTLNATTPALTVAGTAPSPTTYTYTAPSGASAAYTMKYTSYMVRTNFGCSGVTEFPATSETLVSEIDLPDQSINPSDKYTFTYETTPGYPSDTTGRLASVTLPTGGTITYDYSGGSNGITCADGSTATLTRYTPDTGSNYWTYAHSESGTAWTTTITDPQSNQTVMNFQGIYPTETQVYQGSSSSGTLLGTTFSCYNMATPPCNTTAITLPITQQANLLEWPGSGGLQSETVTSYDSYGLVTEVDQYAYGAGAPGSVVRKTLVSYAIALTNGIVGLPASLTIEDGSGNVKAQNTYCYDEGTPSGTTSCNAYGAPTATSGTPQHIAISGSHGNLTTMTSLVTGSTTLGKTFTYYDTGNVNVATDVNTAQTTFAYGSGSCGNSFATSINEPLSLSASAAWNCTGGVQTSATDENGNTVSTSYTDAYFWRPYSFEDQLSNYTYLTYTAQTSVESSMTFNGLNSVSDVLNTVDGLGRSHITQVKESPTSSTYDSTETDYDSLGRPSRFTLPYPGTAGQTNASVSSVEVSYDALSRPGPIASSASGYWSIGANYPQNDVYVTAGPAPTGENTKQRQMEYDALGRLTSVCEITAGTSPWLGGNCAQETSRTGYWTTYTYDLNNNLTGVTQNAQSGTTQARTYVYDDLSRMTSETNPESGTTTYTYDTDSTCGISKGDLVKEVDHAGDTICFAYDALHRMTSTTYSGTYASVTPSRYFVYDAATVDSASMSNAKTRLAEAYTCFSPCTKLTDEGFSYTARGEPSDLYESTPHSGSYYHVNQTYWANGANNVLQNLSGLPTITYGPDGEGRIYSASASSGQNPLTSTTYNVASLPTAVNLGSSDSDSFAYDSNTNLMNKYTFTVNGQSLVGQPGWNPLGTLGSLAITDPFNSSDAQTCTYSHDDLTRIASANCGSIWSQTFTYDPFGNIVKNGTGIEGFSANYSSSTNQMTDFGGFTPTYDSNGNLTNDSLSSYAWDANGRPVTADSVGLTFDALGRIVEQNNGGTYTEIAYTPAQAKLALMSGSTLQKGFVPLTGGSMAVYSATGLDHYRHSDWLGTARLASTPSQTVSSDWASAPFGEVYAVKSGTTADPSFTGQNQDTISTLYDFPAREYNQHTGRWPSPDPAGIASVDPTDPQTWNRYAYVRNSPLGLTDPLGLDPGDCDDPDDFGECCIGFVCCDPDDPFSFGCPPPPKPLPPYPVPIYEPENTGPILIESLGMPPGMLVLPSDVSGMLGNVLGLSTPGCEFGACGGGNGFYQGPGAFPSSGSGEQQLAWLSLAIHLANHTGVSDKIFYCEVTQLEDPSLNPAVVNPSGGGFGAVGLMQVRQPAWQEGNRQLNPYSAGFQGPYSASSLTNPAINIQVGILNFGTHLKASGGNVWAAVKSAGDGTDGYVNKVKACAGQ